VSFPLSFRPLILDLTRWDLAGFPWDWLVVESLEQRLNFVLEF
jgi:hypothetical protein